MLIFIEKTLDIVKQHPNNARIWADRVFQPSYQGPTLVNISLTVQFDKNWELENGKKKIGILTFQKVAKTGNIWKKTVADCIDYLLTVLFLYSNF